MSDVYIIIFTIVVVFIILNLLFAYIYTLIEKISFQDALYLMVANSTTIGSTDQQPITSAGKWFNIFASLVLVIYFIGSFFVIFELHWERFYLVN